MGKEAIDAIVGIITAFIGLGILSVILSKNANTTGVINAVTSGVSTDLGAAMAPVSGSSVGNIPSLNTSSFVS